LQFFGFYRYIGRNGCINNIDVGNGRSLLDTGLLMLLQQESIDVATDLRQAGIVGQISLRNRELLKPLFEFLQSLGDIQLLC